MSSPTRGQMFWLKWRGVADSLSVRVIAQPDHGWSVNRYGALSWIAEPTPQVFTPGQLTVLEQEKSSFEEDRREIESNLEWGVVPPGGQHIIVRDWMLSPFDYITFRPIWRKRGQCPDCGHDGEWISLSLVCPYHGVFAG